VLNYLSTGTTLCAGADTAVEWKRHYDILGTLLIQSARELDVSWYIRELPTAVFTYMSKLSVFQLEYKLF
jgi:hypothetical protein